MERYAEELGRALLNTGEVRVAQLAVQGRLRTALGRLPLASKPAGYFDRYVRYQLAARRGGYDVAHIVDHGYAHLGFSMNPKRTVATFHDAMLLKLDARELVSDRIPRATIAGHRYSLRAMRRMARVITDSASARDDFLRFQEYPPERVIAIPLAVSSSFRPLVCVDDAKRGDPSILHVGHNDFYKNVESILRALPLVQRRLERPVRFRKVGGRFTAAQEQLISSLGIGSSIDRLGMLTEAELLSAYTDSDVLLMPSFHEGFGLPALEAMASGVPVVASNRGSLPEVVGDAALLVNPEDLEGITDAVVRLLTEPLLRDEMTARGIDRARQFTWDRTARATLDVYRAIFGEAS
jgi:glycosyltransferase involved in cell wall biosynthesis